VPRLGGRGRDEPRGRRHRPRPRPPFRGLTSTIFFLLAPHTTATRPAATHRQSGTRPPRLAAQTRAAAPSWLRPHRCSLAAAATAAAAAPAAPVAAQPQRAPLLTATAVALSLTATAPGAPALPAIQSQPIYRHERFEDVYEVGEVLGSGTYGESSALPRDRVVCFCLCPPRRAAILGAARRAARLPPHYSAPPRSPPPSPRPRHRAHVHGPRDRRAVRGQGAAAPSQQGRPHRHDPK
jgi:hypothetical protein